MMQIKRPAGLRTLGELASFSNSLGAVTTAFVLAVVLVPLNTAAVVAGSAVLTAAYALCITLVLRTRRH